MMCIALNTATPKIFLVVISKIPGEHIKIKISSPSSKNNKYCHKINHHFPQTNNIPHKILANQVAVDTNTIAQEAVDVDVDRDMGVDVVASTAPHLIILWAIGVKICLHGIM